MSRDGGDGGETLEGRPKPVPGAAAEVEAFGAPAPAIGDSPWARRVSALGLDDAPREVWQREVDPRLHLRVREDGALALYARQPPVVMWPIADAELDLEPRPDPVAIIDPATGAESPPPARDAWPATGVGRLTSVRVDPRSGYVIFSRVVPEMGSPSIAAVDPRSGEVVWRRPPRTRRMPYTNGMMSWLYDDHPDAEMVFPTQFMRGDEQEWIFRDPFTGEAGWNTEVTTLRSVSPAVLDPRDVVIGYQARMAGYEKLTGLRREDGTPVWDLAINSGEGQGRRTLRQPAYAGKSDHCVVVVELLDLVSRDGAAEVPVTVRVHSRATGELLFTREWPVAPATGVADVLDLRSEVLLTREGSFVRGHSVPDGRRLWSVVPPIATTFDASCRHPHSRWAWLRPLTRGVAAGSASVSASASAAASAFAAPHGLFIHAATGRVLTVADAVHHTPDDHVITRAGGRLACWELPHV